jgi:hypothetical protein
LILKEQVLRSRHWLRPRWWWWWWFLQRLYLPLQIFSSHFRKCEISSSHGGEYEVQVWLLGCTASSPWWLRQNVRLKRRSTIILHGSTSQKTNLNFRKWLLHLIAPCACFKLRHL